jgi:hypothetical protein
MSNRPPYKERFERMEVRAVGMERKWKAAESKLAQVELENKVLRKQLNDIKQGKNPQITLLEEVA